jgi:hypothetical protein
MTTPVYSANKTDPHPITELLLKVALNTIQLTPLACSWPTLFNSVDNWYICASLSSWCLFVHRIVFPEALSHFLQRCHTTASFCVRWNTQKVLMLKFVSDIRWLVFLWHLYSYRKFNTLLFCSCIPNLIKEMIANSILTFSCLTVSRSQFGSFSDDKMIVGFKLAGFCSQILKTISSLVLVLSQNKPPYIRDKFQH